MFEKILVVYSEKESEIHNRCLNDLRLLLPLANFIRVDELRQKDVLVNLVISVGGDGTFIRTSHFLKEEYILGINSEPEFSEGALCSLTCFELEKIKEILSGKFSLTKRNRIKIQINGEVVLERALNEIYFGSRDQFHTSRYLLKLGDRVEEQRSSGLLVVTSTGSQAWYKSAGGEEFSGEELRYLVREPYVSRVFDSKLPGGRVNSEMRFVSKMHHEAVVAVDSNSIYDVKFNDEILICPALNFLNIVGVKND